MAEEEALGDARLHLRVRSRALQRLLEAGGVGAVGKHVRGEDEPACRRATSVKPLTSVGNDVARTGSPPARSRTQIWERAVAVREERELAAVGRELRIGVPLLAGGQPPRLAARGRERSRSPNARCWPRRPESRPRKATDSAVRRDREAPDPLELRQLLEADGPVGARQDGRPRARARQTDRRTNEIACENPPGGRFYPRATAAAAGNIALVSFPPRGSRPAKGDACRPPSSKKSARSPRAGLR